MSTRREFVTILVFVLLSLNVIARNNSYLALSTHSKVSYSSDVIFSYLSQFKGYWGEIKKTKDSFFIIKQDAFILPGKALVNKKWKEEIKNLENMGEESHNLGCSKIKKEIYKCSRTSKVNNNFIYEELIWNSNKEIIAIRSMSQESSETAKKNMRLLSYEGK